MATPMKRPSSPRIRQEVFIHAMYADYLLFIFLNLLPPVLRWVFFKLLCGSLGKGSLIDYGTYLRYPKKIFIGKDVTINRECRIYPSFLVPDARIQIHDGATLAPNVTIFGAGQNPHQSGLPDVATNVVIGAKAYVGGNSTIRYGVTVGEGAVIAAGSVVVSDVEPWTIVGGVPAKQIGERAPE